MIVGGHITIASSDEAADKAFFRDVLKLPNVDAGGGYIIFGLPPCEIAVHEGGGGHTLHLMCEDMNDFLEAVRKLGMEASEPLTQMWGVMTKVTLPGGGGLSVYEPRHKHPKQPGVKTKASLKTAAKKAAPKRKKAPAKKSAAKKTKKKARRR
jgi:hypothetical protein